MKAPEKIYLYPYPTDEIYEVEIKPLEGMIEYTRTDAFIEKACKWMRKNKDHPFIGCEDHQLSGYLTDDFIEDFENYMKGE